MPGPRQTPLIVAAAVVVIVLGFAFGGVAAGFILAGLALGALVAAAARSKPVEPIAPAGGSVGAPTLVLLVADLESSRDASRVADLAGEAAAGDGARALLLAPVEPTTAQRWLSLRGTTREDAQAKLDGARHALRGSGVEVDGEIVDEDPVRAIEDQAAVHGAAAIVLVVPAGECGEEIAEIEDRAEPPVHVVEVARAS